MRIFRAVPTFRLRIRQIVKKRNALLFRIPGKSVEKRPQFLVLAFVLWCQTFLLQIFVTGEIQGADHDLPDASSGQRRYQFIDVRQMRTQEQIRNADDRCVSSPYLFFRGKSGSGLIL